MEDNKNELNEILKKSKKKKNINCGLSISKRKK